jgi:hypothetical protein
MQKRHRREKEDHDMEIDMHKVQITLMKKRMGHTERQEEHQAGALSQEKSSAARRDATNLSVGTP